MVRKIKILISLFVIMLVLSMDLGNFFSNVGNGTLAMEGHEMFEFANLQHNLHCITDAIKTAVTANKGNSKDEKKENSSLVDKYGNALADATTKAVENAIIAKDKDKQAKSEEVPIEK